MNAVQTVTGGDIATKKRTLKTQLPDYTRGEEICNTVTHAIGAVFAVAAIPLLVVMAAMHRNPWHRRSIPKRPEKRTVNTV